MADGILVFAGRLTGAELLTWLLDRGEKISHVVVCYPDDTDILRLVEARGLSFEIHSPSTQARLIAEGHRFAWLLSLWNPYIMKPGTIRLVDRSLNLHPTLLPRFRNSDGPTWIIRLNQSSASGVTLMSMDDGVDTGGIYAQRAVPCPFPISGKDYTSMLKREIVDLFKSEWPAIRDGHIASVPQAGETEAYTHRQTDADRVKDVRDWPELETVMRWLLAHDYAPKYTPEVVIDGRRYGLTLTVTPKD
jgi:hypothetical protein